MIKFTLKKEISETIKYFGKGLFCDSCGIMLRNFLGLPVLTTPAYHYLVNEKDEAKPFCFRCMISMSIVSHLFRLRVHTEIGDDTDPIAVIKKAEEELKKKGISSVSS